jgi:hypothetical protein
VVAADDFHTTVPDNLPTTAVRAIASAPQNATRSEARNTGAPPVRTDRNATHRQLPGKVSAVTPPAFALDLGTPRRAADA